MHILITGTSSGIGNGLARAYLDNGHEVYGISRRKVPALKELNGYHHLQQDLVDFCAVPLNLREFLKEVNELDIVILNAGALPKIGDMQETALGEFKSLMDINVWANKVLLDALFAENKKVGQVIAISSGAAVKATRGWNAYSISKAALNMFTGLYAAEEPNTHFCALAPGLIDTGMQAFISSLPDDDRFPMLKRMKSARGTDEMPSPAAASKILVDSIEKVKTLPSGAFVDVRDL